MNLRIEVRHPDCEHEPSRELLPSHHQGKRLKTQAETGGLLLRLLLVFCALIDTIGARVTRG